MTMHDVLVRDEVLGNGAELRAADPFSEEDHAPETGTLPGAEQLITGEDEKGETADKLSDDLLSTGGDNAGASADGISAPRRWEGGDEQGLADPSLADPALREAVFPLEQDAVKRVPSRRPRRMLAGTDPVVEYGGQEQVAFDDRAPVPVIPAPVPVTPSLDVGAVGTPSAHEPAMGTAPTDEQDDPAWRDHWPDNQLHIVTRLLPRYAQAPALDGALRGRMLADYLEQDENGQVGAMGSLPIYLVPTAIGLTTITAMITRAQKRKERLAPIMVELTGISRQLQDRDGRYAHDRFHTAMALEAWTITRVADKTPQTAVWRGRGRVIETRDYTLASVGLQYQRVTLIVASRQQRPGLRGISIRHTPVDLLVAPDHPHAERFRVGQCLLVEARVDLHTSRLRDDHAELEGLDPEQKARLQIVRNANLQVTMGEFPDDAAEADFTRWVRAGRPLPPPRPERRERVVRGAPVPSPAAAVTAQSPAEAAPQPRHARRGQPARAGGGEHRATPAAAARGRGDQGKRGPKPENS